MDLEKLISDVLEDPTALDNLTEEEIQEINSRINPITGVSPAKESVVNLSVINWRDEYMRKFHETAMVGFVYRQLEDYIPHDEIDAVNNKYDKVIEMINRDAQPNKAELVERVNQDRAKEVSLVKKTCYRIIKKFLDRNHNYNPDIHVRGAASGPGKDQQTRLTHKQMLAKTATEPAIQHPSEREVNERLLLVYNTGLRVLEQADKLAALCEGAKLSDEAGMFKRHAMTLGSLTRELEGIAKPIAAQGVEKAYIEPPADVFYHYHRYITNHYEALREVTSCLHIEPLDIEFAVVYYDHYDSEEAAREDRIKNESNYRYGVHTVSNLGVTLMGPFKQNRDRVDFYNRNTEILFKMMEHYEAQEKLGKDMLEKKIAVEKGRNQRLAGMDAAGLKNYIKAQNTIKELGVKPVLTAEDRERLRQAQYEKEQAEVPEDAIQVDIFYDKQNETGDRVMEKTKFYTQSEKPLHMQENSPYANAYQPKRARRVAGVRKK